MRFFFSFLLSSFFFIIILGFFFYFVLIQKKTQKSEVVYIHQVIVMKHKNKNTEIKKVRKRNIIKTVSQKIKPKKIEQKKVSSKDNFAKGGKDIKFDDIFSNVSTNIKTSKIVYKKQHHITKNRVDTLKAVKEKLSKLKTSVSITNLSGNNKSIKQIQNELSKIWQEIETNDGDFIKIKIDIFNNNLNYVVIATNLDTIRLNLFVNKLKQIDVQKIKNLSITILFRAQLKE